MNAFLMTAHNDPNASSAPRRLPWREADRQTAGRQPRRLVTGIALCAIAGAIATIPALPLHATSDEGPSLGDLLVDLRSAASMSVDVNVVVRFFPTATDTSEPTDGLPSFGTALFRDQGFAWRIENEFDPERFALWPSLDSSYDGSTTVVTLLRHTGEASVTHAGEQDYPYTNAPHPWFLLGCWLEEDPASVDYHFTRTDLFEASTSKLHLADGGWEEIPWNGGTAQATVISYGGGPSYRVIAPAGHHDRPDCIEIYAKDGHLRRSVYFADWQVPTWGSDSAVTPRPLPFVVTEEYYSPAGEVAGEWTISIHACSVDMPIPADDLVTPLDGATTLFDEDTRTPLW